MIHHIKHRDGRFSYVEGNISKISYYDMIIFDDENLDKITFIKNVYQNLIEQLDINKLPSGGWWEMLIKDWSFNIANGSWIEIDPYNKSNLTSKNTECNHEYVNVGFTTITMACKHCGKDK